MSGHDPLRIAQVIGDLAHEVEAWVRYAQEAMSHGERSQALSFADAQEAERTAAIAADQLSIDQADIRDGEGRLAALEERLSSLQQRVDITGAQAHQLVAAAQAANSGWLAERDMALDWLARAQARLDLARQERAAAEVAVRAADSNLQAASRTLDACKRDPNTRDCSGPARYFDRCADDLGYAQHRLGLAVEEERAAEVELAAAAARVECCERALAHAARAANDANAAATLMDHARAETDKCGGHTRSARNFTDTALAAADDEDVAVAAMVDSARVATAGAEAGATSLMTASGHYQDAQRHAYDATGDLRAAQEQLRAYDAVNLGARG